MNSDESSLSLYKIELEKFQGPLDLLLHLIKKNELDIYDIEVAEITRQYLVYLDMMRDLNMEVASEFLVMASTLVYIKSRMLLPPADDEEEEEVEDPREELIRRLIDYQRYKTSARELDERPRLERDIFLRPELENTGTPEDQFLEASLFQLIDAFQKVLTQVEKKKPHEVFREAFPLEEGMKAVKAAFRDRKSIRFGDLFSGSDSRHKIVTLFIAVLELIKKGQMSAVQKGFGEPLRLIADDIDNDKHPSVAGGKVDHEK